MSRDEMFARIRQLVQDGRDNSSPGTKPHTALLEIDNIVQSLKSIDPKEVLANINPPTIALQVTTGAKDGDQITYRVEVPPQENSNDFDTLMTLAEIVVGIHTGNMVEDPKS